MLGLTKGSMMTNMSKQLFADPDPESQNNADPDPKHCIKPISAKLQRGSNSLFTWASGKKWEQVVKIKF